MYRWGVVVSCVLCGLSPDPSIHPPTKPTTPHGRMVGDAPLYIYCSPYMRTKQTLARIVECLDGNTIVGVREEPRLTEQVKCCWAVQFWVCIVFFCGGGGQATNQ